MFAPDQSNEIPSNFSVGLNKSFESNSCLFFWPHFASQGVTRSALSPCMFHLVVCPSWTTPSKPDDFKAGSSKGSTFIFFFPSTFYVHPQFFSHFCFLFGISKYLLPFWALFSDSAIIFHLPPPICSHIFFSLGGGIPGCFPKGSSPDVRRHAHNASKHSSFCFLCETCSFLVAPCHRNWQLMSPFFFLFPFVHLHFGFFSVFRGCMPCSCGVQSYGRSSVPFPGELQNFLPSPQCKKTWNSTSQKSEEMAWKNLFRLGVNHEWASWHTERWKGGGVWEAGRVQHHRGSC